MTDMVFLQCVKERSKLRMKIISPGYHNDANCQCPRNIRVDGKTYSVPAYAISFSEGPRSKFFYRINGSHITEVLDVSVRKVYEDESTTDCIICMSNEKSVVFAPCGHYICCEECSNSLATKKCPICRNKIHSVVKRESIQCD
jgi:Zinc finger, C3HC4 type (RING finger)